MGDSDQDILLGAVSCYGSEASLADCRLITSPARCNHLLVRRGSWLAGCVHACMRVVPGYKCMHARVHVRTFTPSGRAHVFMWRGRAETAMHAPLCPCVRAYSNTQISADQRRH